MPLDPSSPPPATPAAAVSPSPELAVIVLRIAKQLDPYQIGTGALASLRRLDPDGALAEPALQRILWGFVPETWLGSDDAFRRWALIVHALALAAPNGLDGAGREGSLGAALFAAGFSEGRLTRLLEARPADLPVMVPRAVRFLVAKRRSFDPVALARWVQGVAAGGGRADRQRTDVAREYYRAERQAAG